MKKLKNNHDDYSVDYLIVGTGNVAIRHLENITSLSNRKTIAVCKRYTAKLSQKFKKKEIKVISDFDNISPKSSKSIAIICSAASNHVNDAEILAQKGFNILLEKPLTVPNTKIKNLLTICKDNKLKTLVGYNMRFTNRIKSIGNIIKNRKYGDIKEIKISVETDFRKWRKGLNYKKSVSFDKNLGGGVINELSHEIDYLNLLFGKPKKVTVKNMTTGNKKYNFETHISATFEYAQKKPVVTMNLDMLSSHKKRYCKIYFDNSTIMVDHMKNSLLIETNKQKILKIFKDKLNDSYVREMNNLIKSIKNNSSSELSIEKCMNTQSIINAMHKSLLSNKGEVIKQ